MSGPAAELAGRLAREAEAVCRHYLSNGRRAGCYWQVGDVFNTPGRSLYVRLHGNAAGRWTDAATGEHGDLLDVIGHACDLRGFADILAEARRFLREPPSAPPTRCPPVPTPTSSVEAARRLFAAGRPIAGTLADRYLRVRGITVPLTPGPLRYHPACYHRYDGGGFATWPALLAAVTDQNGEITGVQRTWLARDGTGKAPLAEPRRAMGLLLAHGVRFGAPDTMLVAGEGIETILSLRAALPGLPCVAALSASHLVALQLPDGLRRLYIARDADRAGSWAAERLTARALAAGIDVWPLVPLGGDFNDDLRGFGCEALRAQLVAQVAANDIERLRVVQR